MVLAVLLLANKGGTEQGRRSGKSAYRQNLQPRPHARLQDDRAHFAIAPGTAARSGGVSAGAPPPASYGKTVSLRRCPGI